MELFNKGIVDNKQHVIENKDIFKLSPFKELSVEQLDLKEKVIEFCKEHVKDEERKFGSLYVIKGEGGREKCSSKFNL